MTAVAVVAGGIQALFIHAVSRRAALPAAGRYDTVQAHFLVRGQWFIDPATAAAAHAHVPTAAHPPLPTLLLAIADVASATTSTKHMVFLAIVFVASVVLAGITVRDLVGERAGVLAALVFATFPLLWVNPATVGPETTVIAVTTLVLFASVRFWVRPSSGHAALVGLALGVCALTRTDLVALVVLIGLPLGLLVRGIPWAARLRALALMGVIALVVVGPWVGRNLSVFDHTVVLSEDYGPVVAGANCPTTASGDLEGWWSPTCLARVPVTGVSPSATTADQVHVGRVFVAHHLGSSVGVAAVRLGRLWNVYRPLQGADLQVGTGRPAWVSRLGLWYFYVLVPVALIGALVLRRRRLLLFPFLALILLSSLTAVLAFGDARFALEADVALAMLAGVALDALVDRFRRQRSARPGLHSARGAQVRP
jgi:4-amino-4-deoxy-L-arabinose transferase-like glycosyltransferase